MKTDYNKTKELTSNFDDELKAILVNDLSTFRASRGKFLTYPPSNQQEVKRRLVA